MKAIDSGAVEAYAVDDWILRLLDSESTAGDESCTSQRWLRDSMAKRAVYAELYGDLLRTNGKRVLDVGGGLSAFTRLLARQHDYTLVDVMAHDAPASDGLTILREQCRVCVSDWVEFDASGRYDVIVANDLFPNVDQRLQRFLDQMLPCADEVRLSLTWYEDGRWYVTSRVGADEIFTIVAWDGERTGMALRPYAKRIVDADLQMMARPMVSAWPNGRQVCTVKLRGHRAACE